MEPSPRSTDQLGHLAPAHLRALDLLRRGRRFVITGHMRPDGDCIGAQAALSRVLESLGKEVWIINPDPPEARFEYLSRECRYRAFQGGELPAHDVSVLLDFCELERTGVMAPVLAKHPSKKMVVDHHLNHGEPWWDEAFVDTSAAATGLLVYRIARALGVSLDTVAARGVFTSLVTDTGWFKYSNTDAETLSIASEMVQLGADPTAIFAALYQQRSHQHPPFIGRLLSRTEYFADRRLAYVDQPVSETEASEYADTDEVLDILRSVRTVELVLYLRELKDGTCKLSARSKSDYDVNALARKFGGGGHKKASGATIPGRLSEVRPKILSAAIEGFGPDGASAGAEAMGDAAPGDSGARDAARSGTGVRETQGAPRAPGASGSPGSSGTPGTSGARGRAGGRDASR
jgi:nanoRNase/pAp phosphatase (c-di-AMP/oligoRNAs hydrolase)